MHDGAQRSGKQWWGVGRTGGVRGARTGHLIVEGTDVQRRVPRGVLCSWLGPVEEQVLQVLGMATLAGLGGSGQGPVSWAGLP